MGKGGVRSRGGSEPCLFLCSSSRFAAFHSEPCGREGKRHSPSARGGRPPLPPLRAAHQVEVREDAGCPVLLGHEQQHLVIDEVTVLLERAAQPQLQGLADLQVGRRGEAQGL